jgi:hypothetical protein
MSGTTNFLVFNPTQANQETDADYLADTTRLSGALDGNGWPDSSANKLLYQVSTMTAALAQMLANKGFSVLDANYAALVTQLGNILTTADGRGGLQNLAWASTLVLNAALFEGFAVPLQGTTAIALTGVSAGALYVMLYTQDSVGGHAVTFGSGFGAGAMQPDPMPYVVSAQLFMANAALNLVPIGPLISQGGINGTPIGNSKPSTGVFTTLTLAAGAPAGQVLTGNGASFVAQALAPNFTSGSSGSVQWLKYPNGLIEQWITTPITSNSYVSFITGGTAAFSTTPFVFTTNNKSSAESPITASSVSTAGAQLGCNGGDDPATWLARGY